MLRSCELRRTGFLTLLANRLFLETKTAYTNLHHEELTELENLDIFEEWQKRA